MSTVLHIKNMVCQRCVRVVREELERAGYKPLRVELGEAEIADEDTNRGKLAALLAANGFELLEEKSAKLVNDIKAFVIALVRSGKLENEKQKLSELVEAHFHKDYGYLSQLFTQAKTTTLERYIIAQKVELVKEWLAYGELTLSQMAVKLGYSSVAHLSAQFKQITGFTPSAFKQLKHHKRKGLDEL